MPHKYAVLQMSRFRVWLFLYATRIVEFVNGAFITGFSLVFIFDTLFGESKLYEMGSYADFKNADGLLWVAFLIIGLLQFAAMTFYSIRSNKASGFVLIISSAIWAIIAGTFFSSRGGVITTGPVIYSIWALVALMAGYELLSINKKIEGVVNREA